MHRALLISMTLASAIISGFAQSPVWESFNQPGAQGSVLPLSSWVGNVLRQPETITITGTAKDDNGWGAIGLNFDASGLSYVTILGQRDAGNQAASLVLQFEDSTLMVHTVAVSTSQFPIGTLGAVQFALGAWPAGFNATRVSGWSIGGGTTGLVALRMTLDPIALSAVAAPSLPIIVVEPADRLAGVGTGTTLSVSATGGQSLLYRWKFNGSPLAGATSAVLALSDVKLTDTGAYAVDITNAYGTTLSRSAQLAVVNLRASQTLASAGYLAGTPLGVGATITHSGYSGSVVLQVLLPMGWNYVPDAAADPVPSVVAPGVVEWRWSTLPASPVTVNYSVNSPSAAKDPQTLSGLVQLTQAGIAGAIALKPDPLLVPLLPRSHSADINGDFRISLLELTRVIELYSTRKGSDRTGAYRVDASGEDGFNPDGERTKGSVNSALMRFHSGDSNRDGGLDLFELLRVIELYNVRTGSIRTGAYRFVSGTEDGFEPGAQ